MNLHHFHIIAMKKIIIVVFPLIWFVVHWVVPRVYVPLCVPSGIYGFVQSLFLTDAPHCVALRYLMNMSCFNINHAWISIGTAMLGYATTSWGVQRPKIV